MNSGAPTFGTPEAAHITYGAGQLARRLGLPYRSGGAFCGSKLPDAQAAYESANRLNMALLAGVNFMLHACGWLEGGLVASYEKFVMDADQLGTLHHLAQGIEVDRERPGDGRDPRSGPGGHYLGCEHTQANFKTAFWRTDLLDYKPFETWAEEGARDTEALAAERSRSSWPTTAARPRRGHRRGAGRLRRPQEGRDARRLHLRSQAASSRRRAAAPRPSARSAPRRAAPRCRPRRLVRRTPPPRPPRR